MAIWLGEFYLLMQVFTLNLEMEPPRHFNRTINKDNPNPGVFKLLEEIRPDWKQEDIVIEVKAYYLVN